MVITTNKANITRASFDRIYDELSSLQKEVDTNAGTISVVGDQLAKVKAENSSLNSQINELDAEIVGKETQFVDKKKNAQDPQWYSGIFTQQDYLTIGLMFAYLLLSISYYVSMTFNTGVSLTGLLMYLAKWAGITLIAFIFFNKFV